MSIENVSVLGMGLMGSRMARRLVDAGLGVTVWNRDTRKSKPLGEAGAVVAATPAEAVAAADVVITMLANGPVVEEVVFGQGVDAAMLQGSVLIDMSSIPPGTAKDHAVRLRERGLHHLDAPVSGGTVGAAEGSLAILCGGESEVLERCRPVFDLLGRVTHVGPHGSGQLTKLCNQVIVATTIGAVSEALLMAQAGGAVPGAVIEALQGGFADSRILREHGQRMVERNWRPGGIVRHQLKDLNSVHDQAVACSLSLPILEEVRQLFAAFLDHGGGEHDHSALLLELERRNRPHRVGDGPDLEPEPTDAGS